MRFKLRQMEVFRAVMLTGSINAAAKMLYVSQPAVSKLVAHTETTLGPRRFERAKGRPAPPAKAPAVFFWAPKGRTIRAGQAGLPWGNWRERRGSNPRPPA